MTRQWNLWLILAGTLTAGASLTSSVSAENPIYNGGAEGSTVG